MHHCYNYSYFPKFSSTPFKKIQCCSMHLDLWAPPDNTLQYTVMTSWVHLKKAVKRNFSARHSPNSIIVMDNVQFCIKIPTNSHCVNIKNDEKTTYYFTCANQRKSSIRVNMYISNLIHTVFVKLPLCMCDFNPVNFILSEEKTCKETHLILKQEKVSWK